MSEKPSKYELQAVSEIHRWKDPRPTLLDRTVQVITWPVNAANEAASRLPGIDWAVERSVGRLIALIGDIATWSVRTESIWAEYRAAEHEVSDYTDVFKLDLEHVDRAIGRLNLKYQALAAGEGAAAGFTGVFGVPADVVALAALCLRAIGEYAAYCGFNITEPEERLFAMSILDLASSPNQKAKSAALAQLIRVARDTATRKVLKGSQKSALGQIMETVARSFGARLTYDKMAQFLPVAGALVGGGLNAYYAARVCEAAANLYRERFLARKYGPEMIEKTVEPAPPIGGQTENSD